MSGELFLILVAWVVLAYFVGSFASGKELNFWTFFGLSLPLTPILGFVAALVVLGRDNRFPKPETRQIVGGLVALVIIVVAFLLPQIDSVGENSGAMRDIVLALAYVVMALGLNVVVGFAGLLDLGYVAFFAIGAYIMGWFASDFFQGRAGDIHLFVSDIAENIPGFHVNFLIILIAATFVTAAFGALLGFPTLRLRGDYIAIVTLAFGEIILRIAVNGKEGVVGLFGNFNLTNGREGINLIDKPDLPFLGQFETLNQKPWFYVALVMVLIVVFVNFRLRDSRLGRAWIAVREDEVAAVSMGIPTTKVKLYSYALGAAMGGMAGAFIGAFNGSVNADQFEFSFSIFVLAMVILGGIGNIWGVIVGSLALSFINTRLIPETLKGVPEKFGLNFEVEELGFAVFGFLLVIMMVLRPQGLLPEKRRARELTEHMEDFGGGDETVQVKA